MVKVLMLIRGGVDLLRRPIKIMKADGTVMKLLSPVSVKEILINYPNHAIVETATLDGLRIGSPPLPKRAGLVAGHLYYLIPLPLVQDELVIYDNNSKRGPFARASSDHSIPSASSWLQPPSSAAAIAATTTATDSTRYDATDKIHIRGGVRIVSSSYSTHGSTVRVKLRLRKKDLASFLSAKKANIVMENVVLAPSIQCATRKSPWKPRLDTIVETHNLLGDL